MRYLYKSDLIPMTDEPHQVLEAQLEAREITKTAFAKRVGKSFQTVWNWTKGIGFGPDQRAIAARGLNEAPDYFEHPDLAQQRETYRLSVLKKFRASRVAKRITPEEWRSLETFKWPEEIAPTESKYWGLVLVIRGQLTPGEFTESADYNEQSDEQDAQRVLPVPRAKKSPKRVKRPTKTRKTHR